MKYQLRFAGKHYEKIKQHLFPGDGKEAVAVVLCGRYTENNISILLTHEVVLIPHKECERDADFIHWKTDRIVSLLEKADKNNMAILKIHSHPEGYNKFSIVDDKSDKELFTSVFGWVEGDDVHASAIMMPDGNVFGRVFNPSLEQTPISKVSVAGDNILIWETGSGSIKTEPFSFRTRQAFGDKTFETLSKLKIGIVGCSGTGSPTIEQLARLGVGEIVIIDPDIIEDKNLNRILNCTSKDAEDKRPKCEVLKEAVQKIGINTKVVAFNSNLYSSKESLNELITCDVIFGCVDSVDGRHLLSLLCNFYLIPYFDIGVKLTADGKGGINSIVAAVNYIQPAKSTLLTRKLYTIEDLESADLYRQNPSEYQEQYNKGYIRGVSVNRPAVISINMSISSIAVNELLNRIHSYKDEHSSDYARVMIDFCGGAIINEKESSFDEDSNAIKWAGRGDCKPFLRLSGLRL